MTKSTTAIKSATKFLFGFAALACLSTSISACISSSASAPASFSPNGDSGNEPQILAACLDGSHAKIELMDLGKSSSQVITGKLHLGAQSVTFSADFEIATTEEDDEGIVFEGLAGVAEASTEKSKATPPTRMKSIAFDRISSKGEGLVILQFGKQYVELSSCTFNKKALAMVRGQETRF